MFQVTPAAHGTLPLMSYWFIDQEDPGLARKLEIQPMSVQKTDSRLKQMRNTLNARCKGLLNVQFYDSDNIQDSSLSSSVLFNWKVDFLHRTVRDFPLTTGMQSQLEEWAGPDFDADIVICQSIIAQIKSAPQDEEYFKEGGPIASFIGTFMYHVKYLTRDAPLKAIQASLIDELNRTLLCHKSLLRDIDEALPSLQAVHPSYVTGELPSSDGSIWRKLSDIASRVMNRMT